MVWPQTYTPLGGVGVSALVAALPIVTLLGLLAFFHVRAHRAALAGLLVALGLAVSVYRMPPGLAFRAAGFGAAFGLFPIGWLILNAIFLYQLSVETGQFTVLQAQVAGVSRDRRIQALLIAFSFGAFIEGAAGFGAPVAITGALMIGLGFKPLEAAKLALIGNTAPVAFGSLGIPLTTLASVTGLDVQALSAMVGRQLPVFSVIVPFWLIAAQAGWRGMSGVWPACLVTGLSFAVTQFLVSNFLGPQLVDLASAAVSLVSLVGLMQFWRPGDTPAADAVPAAPRAGPRANVRAWLPWIFLTVFVALWSVPAVKAFLNGRFGPALPVPGLHQLVQRVPPVVPAGAKPEEAIFKLELFSATGTALLLAGGLAGLCLGLRPARLLALYGQTLWRVRISLLTIALMLALGYTTRYSGTDTTMGLAMAGTGWLFPFFSPLIGWLGVALTGSDTSSNVLFGNLQQVTAQQLGLPPLLMAASNSSGGVMGKMISPQSIVVASTATSLYGEEGQIIRRVFIHSVVLVCLMGALVCLQAYVFPFTAMVPR